MAEAIEQAFVVVCCMSQKYKDSPNCRAGLTSCDFSKRHISLFHYLMCMNVRVQFEVTNQLNPASVYTGQSENFISGNCPSIKCYKRVNFLIGDFQSAKKQPTQVFYYLLNDLWSRAFKRSDSPLENNHNGETNLSPSSFLF